MLSPDYFYTSVHAVPYGELHSRGIRGLIFDVDNTLTAFDSPLPDEKTAALIARLQGMGFSLSLVTNNTGRRIREFNSGMQLPAVANALKPFTRGIRRAMREMGTTHTNSAIIGDQLFSDIWGGKRAGITTILVEPITRRDFWFVHIKRFFEQFLLKGRTPIK
jgi:HAD superfamily phosphatase (TIGR01668 family)